MGTKSGLSERVEMIGSIQGILCLLLAASTGLENDSRGENQRIHIDFSHCLRRTALRSTVQLLSYLAPWRPHRQKRLGVNVAFLVQGDPPQLQGPDTLDPVCATQQYTEPEVYMERYNTALVDVWSLGVIMLKYTYGFPRAPRQRRGQHKNSPSTSEESGLAWCQRVVDYAND